MLKSVEKLVKHGVAVHLLKQKSKAPVNSKWSSVPVLTFEQLEKAYKPGMNVGVRTGEPSFVNGYYLHIIDFDLRVDEDFDEAREALTDLFPNIDSWGRVASGSGGRSRHYYFFTDRPFRSKKLAHSTGEFRDKEGKKHWNWEIELFGTGKQAAMPPSIHPDTGKPYKWIMPIDFIDLMLDGGPILDSETLEMIVGVQSDESETDDERIKPLGLELDEIRDTIERLPKDDYIEDRDGWLKVGMAIHHETGGSAEGFELWIECSKISEKFDKKDQKRVWRSFKTRSKPFRMASLISVVRDVELEADIDNLDDEEGDDFDEPKKRSVDDLLGDPDNEPSDEDALFQHTERARKLKAKEVEAELEHVPPKVKRLNRKHAVAFVKGKTIIITEKAGGEVDFGNTNALHEWYENDRVATEKATEPVSKYWLRHKKRRQYPEGVGFYPNRETPGMYNLWRGWSVEPDNKKSCELILWHIKHVICSGNKEHYDYLLGWLAHMVQYPEDKPGVAVVLRGKKGGGKDTVANYVGRMFKSHYMMINQQRHLTGNFNAHQERLLLLHVEEGFWAGNKGEEGPLKSLITSEFATIERKGIDAFQVNSVLRIFMSSNERWVVPASSDERRYFVLDIDDAYTVNGRKSNDRIEYFNKIRHERDNGGPEALLYYLLTYNLRDFRLREVPETLALADQKLAGLRGPVKWWSELLFAGDLDFDAYDIRGPVKGFGNWITSPVVASTEAVFDAYNAWHKKHRFQGEIASNALISRLLKELVPNIKSAQIRNESRDRQRFYIFPPIAECRRSFEQYTNSVFPWNYNDIEELPIQYEKKEDDFDNLDEMEEDI